MDYSKSEFIGNYLRQQSQACAPISTSPPSLAGSSSSHQIIVASEQISLEEFKEFVKKYVEIDNWLKKARDLCKEKRKQRDQLSEVITKFMLRYDIDDLNSSFGKISCKVKKVKAPISQKGIKEKISDYFKENDAQGRDVIQKVFEERPVVEKVSLRRLKIS